MTAVTTSSCLMWSPFRHWRAGYVSFCARRGISRGARELEKSSVNRCGEEQEAEDEDGCANRDVHHAASLARRPLKFATIALSPMAIFLARDLLAFLLDTERYPEGVHEGRPPD
jgi:hypothetical protein